MIEEYFNKFDKEIRPRNFNYPAFLIHYGILNSQIENLQKSKSQNKISNTINIIDNSKKQTIEIPKLENLKTKTPNKIYKKKKIIFNSSKSNKKTNNKILFSNININTNNKTYSNKLENDSRKTVDFMHETSNLQNLYNKLLFENREKEKELIELKLVNQKNGNYLLNLEKVLSKMKEQPKGIFMNTIYSTIKPNTISNFNLNFNNENNEKNLNKIMIIEGKIPVEINKEELIFKIEKLKEFKENLLSIIKQNNLLNMKIYEKIKKLEKLMKDLKTKINERNLNISIGKNYIYLEAKNNNIEELQITFNNLIKDILESVKIKQNEYSILLNIKKNNTEYLLKIINKLKLENENLDKIIQEKNNEIDKIKDETEFIIMNEQNLFEDTLRSELLKSNRSDNKPKNKTDLLVKEMKRCVKNSVIKIKRNFDMKEIENQEFVSNIQSQIKKNK